MKHWLEVTKLDERNPNKATTLIHKTQQGGGGMTAREKIDLNAY